MKPIQFLRFALPLLGLAFATTSVSAQRGPSSSTLILDCGQAGQITIVSPSTPTPLGININGGVLIATSVTYFVNDPNTNQILFTQTSTYASGHGAPSAGRQGSLITCTSQPQPFSDPNIGDGLLTLVITGFRKP